VNYLTIEDILDIRARVTANNPNSVEVRTFHGLMSALAAPQRAFFGEEAYPTLSAKAGALVYALVQHHPFWDGNKRIAAEALRLFLRRNARELLADEGELRRFTSQIARGELRGDDVVRWLEAHL
jgi:death-on-curing protein